MAETFQSSGVANDVNDGGTQETDSHTHILRWWDRDSDQMTKNEWQRVNSSNNPWVNKIQWLLLFVAVFSLYLFVLDDDAAVSC